MPNWTVYFILATAAAIAAYDAGVDLTGLAPTISSTVRAWDKAWPLMKWLVAGGMVVLWGHLFESNLWR